MVSEEQSPKTVIVEPCPHCGEEFPQNKKGQMLRARHIKEAHPDTTQRARSEQAEEEYLGSLPPLGARFYEALKRIIPKSPPKIKTMTDVFSRNVASLGSNKELFRSWVKRYGLTDDQLAMLEDEMFGYGLDWGSGSPQPGVLSLGPQGGTLGYIPQPGGGMQPVFFVMPNQPQQPPYPSQPGQPISISMPPYTPPQPPMDTDLLRREFQEEIRSLREEIRNIANRPAPSLPSVQGGRVRRIPILDESGNQVRDASGNLVMQEVPYDEALSTIEALKNTGMLVQSRPVREFDEEKYELKTKEMIRDIVKEVAPKPEGSSDAEFKLAVQEATAKAQEALKQDLSALNEELKDLREKQATRDTEERISRIVSERVGPLQEEISRLERQAEDAISSRNLSDSQYTLKHKENLVKAYSDLVTELISSVKGDLKPLLTTALGQSLSQSLRQQGFDDSSIAQIVQSIMSTPSVAPTGKVKSGLAGRVAEARSKWVKD